jgi:hypothetical protein
MSLNRDLLIDLEHALVLNEVQTFKNTLELIFSNISQKINGKLSRTQEYHDLEKFILNIFIKKSPNVSNQMIDIICEEFTNFGSELITYHCEINSESKVQNGFSNDFEYVKFIFEKYVFSMMFIAPLIMKILNDSIETNNLKCIQCVLPIIINHPTYESDGKLLLYQMCVNFSTRNNLELINEWLVGKRWIVNNHNEYTI